MEDLICEKAQTIFCANLEDWRDEPGFSAMDSVIEWENAASNLCESQIEQQLLAQLMFTGFGFNVDDVEVWDSTMPFPRPENDVVVAPQFEVGRYRLDFAIFVRVHGEELKIAVECDGHEFHSRTKEQAKADRARDRMLHRKGWRVFRFTGSEIWSDVAACCDEIGEFAAAWYEDVFVRHGDLQPHPHLGFGRPE